MRNDLKSDENNRRKGNQPASQPIRTTATHICIHKSFLNLAFFLFQLQCKLIIITFNDRKQLFSTFFQHFNEPCKCTLRTQLDEKKMLYPQHVWDSVSIAKINKLWTISLITNTICVNVYWEEWTRHQITVSFPRAHADRCETRTRHTIFRFLACFKSALELVQIMRIIFCVKDESSEREGGRRKEECNRTIQLHIIAIMIKLHKLYDHIVRVWLWCLSVCRLPTTSRFSFSFFLSHSFYSHRSRLKLSKSEWYMF